MPHFFSFLCVVALETPNSQWPSAPDRRVLCFPPLSHTHIHTLTHSPVQVMYLGPDHETRMDDPKIVWRSTAHVRARHGGTVPTEREPASTAKFQTDQELMRKMQKVRCRLWELQRSGVG